MITRFAILIVTAWFFVVPAHASLTAIARADFQNMGQWYGDPERAIAAQQIAILRDALALSPLDTGLRDALLECYYDTAVAEMQFGKQKLAGLAATHLGLTVTSPFVIDDEIKT